MRARRRWPVLANDTDTDGGPKTIASTTDPAHGTVVITGGGTGLTYQPDANYCNSLPLTPADTFTYTLTPGGSTATVSMGVFCADDAPTAVNDAATVPEDTAPVLVDVLANDTDPDGGTMQIATVSDPAHGTAVLLPLGPGPYTAVLYQPDAAYCNTQTGGTADTFTYTLTPGGSTATVAMTVTCVDDAPGAVADAATVSEDAAATAVDVLGNDANADGGPLAIASATDPPGGTVVLTPPGPGPYSGLTYQPDANYCNTQSGGTPDTFQYTLTPGGASTTVSMTVTCVNDPPVVDLDANDNQGVAGIDVARTFPEGDPAVTVADGDATITDVDSATLTTLTVTLTNLLDATDEVLDVDLTGADPAFTKSYDTTTTPGTGVLTITASPAQPVVDVQTLLRLVTYVNTAEDPDTTPRVIEVVAHDGTDASTPAAVSTIAIVAADDAPVAVNDTATVAEDAAATAVPVLANDTDADGGDRFARVGDAPGERDGRVDGGGTAGCTG